jgi:hypothetical protein
MLFSFTTVKRILNLEDSVGSLNGDSLDPQSSEKGYAASQR